MTVSAAKELHRAASHAARLEDEAQQLRTPAAHARAAEASALVARQQGDFRRALDAGERALALYRDLGDHESQARTLLCMATAQRWSGDITRQAALLERAIAVAGERATCRLWYSLAVCHTLKSDYAAATEALAKARAARRSALDDARIFDAELVLASRRRGVVDFEELEQRAEAVEELGHLDIAGLLYQHGAVYLQRAGRYEESEACGRRSLGLGLRTGARLRQCYAWYYLSICARLGRGDLDAAESAAWRVVELARDHDARDEADGYCELGHVALARGEDATPWLERARSVLASASRLPSVSALEASIADAAEGRPLVRGQSRTSLTPAQRDRARLEGLLR